MTHDWSIGGKQDEKAYMKQGHRGHTHGQCFDQRIEIAHDTASVMVPLKAVSNDNLTKHCVYCLGYIDLSKRRVSATDIAKCEERYNKSKAVHSIMSTVAKKENKDMEALYEQLAWPLYSKYGHAYDAFKAALK